MTTAPYLFNEFLESGLSESVSPFLTKKDRAWGKHVPLRASILAAICLTSSFILSFFPNTLALSHLLLCLVYFLAGIPSLIGAIEDLSKLIVNIDILMTLAAFLSILIGSGMEGGLLLVLFSLSGAIEEAVTAKAKGALSHLRELSPPKATIVGEDGMLFERSVRDITVGTKILVRSAEVVPLDGLVIEGTSSVNLVHLTGENLPVTKKVDDEVPAGARNLEAPLTLTVLRTSTESTLARLIGLITAAQEMKPKLQRWIDKLSHGYAITIISLSFVFALLFPLLFSIPLLGVEGSVYRALTFLIAASPCALVIAIPIGYLSAISACARRGILLKGGVILDALADCKTIAFDKTGTLTSGELSLVDFRPLQPMSLEEKSSALRLAFGLERGAIHPIAKAICKFAQDQGLFPAFVEQIKVIAGYGVSGFAKDQEIYIGKPSYHKLPGEQQSFLKNEEDKAREAGRLLATLSIGPKLILMQFQDLPRPNIANLLKRLKERFNTRLLMLTGDHQTSANAVASTLNLDEVHADLLPENKLELVSSLSSEEPLAMVGDGINDAPALARATVGIAMGSVGTTSAVDAADIVLLHDNIELLDWLFAKAHKTKKVILENVMVAFSAIIFASIPALLGIVPLWLAVILHEGGTVIVGLNSLRLLKKKD